MKFDFRDKKRVALVLLAVILMGVSVSFLVKVNLGTDPYTCMNLGISDRLPLTFGTWQALLNIVLLLVVLCCDKKQCGIGTIANMFLVGYSADFTTWLMHFVIPDVIYETMWIRILVMIPALVLFVIAASLYMSCDLGVSPYDAVAFILHEKMHHFSFRVVRIAYDLVACVIGFLLGSTVGVVTVLIALALGPVIEWMKGWLEKIGL